jgi:hypothetical protein
VDPAGIPALQKTNPWIIIIAVAVVVCCACFGVTGLLIAFGPEILHELGLAAVLHLPGVI